MSYQKLGQVICLFTFPIPLCDDAVQDIDKEANNFIAVDMNSGYWQIVAEEETHEILAFVALNGNKRRKVMPLGFLIAAPIFVAMMIKLKM